MSDLDVYKEWLGIPEGERPPDHYTLLRLKRFEDDEEKVQSFYKKLNAHVRKYATGAYLMQSQDLLNELAKAMLCLTDPERKREYDESLGREFDHEEESAERTATRFLIDRGVISRSQVSEVEEFADARGLTIRDALVQMKLADREAATRALAHELGRPFVDLEETQPDDTVLDQVPRSVVKRHTVLPLFTDDDVVLIACSEEPTMELEDEIRLRFGLPMRGVMAVPRAINQQIAKHYAAGVRDEAASATGKGAKGKSQGDGKPGKRSKPGPKARRPRMNQLSAEEQHQRKQIGIIILCWSVIGGALLDYFLVAPMLGYVFSPFATLVAAAGGFGFVKGVLWR